MPVFRICISQWNSHTSHTNWVLKVKRVQVLKTVGLLLSSQRNFISYPKGILTSVGVTAIHPSIRPSIHLLLYFSKDKITLFGQSLLWMVRCQLLPCAFSFHTYPMECNIMNAFKERLSESVYCKAHLYESSCLGKRQTNGMDRLLTHCL